MLRQAGSHRCGFACRQRHPSLLVLALVLVLACCCCFRVCAAQLLKEPALESAAKLRNAFLTGSRIDELVKAYEAARDAGLFTVENADPEAEVKQLTDKISQMVARKTQALKETVVMAEEAASGYKYNANIKMDGVHFVECKDMKEDSPGMYYDRRFLQKVAKNHSAVHIPTNTYPGQKDVLNELAWTEKLEQKMLDMVANEEYFQDTVRYMYLVTDLGLLRLYPGMKWRKLEGVTTMYDARRTSWFIEGSTCPKDLLVLIDTSGSMHGQNLLLTRQAAKSLIATLGENDYVAVGQYPGKAKSSNAEQTDSPHLLHDKEPIGRSTNSTTCFHSFVQATKRHKDRLFHQIDNITAKGIVDLTEALQFAYEMFSGYMKMQNTSTDNQGAKCSSVVALFTDGDISSDMEKARAVISHYRKLSDDLDKVRIFVYSIGQHRNDDLPLMNLACKNRGAFTDVPSMGFVTSEVQEGYLRPLRSVAALHESKLPVESRGEPTMLLHSHFDSKRHRTFLFFSENQIKDLGFGVLTSLTLPIYNASGNNSFLGLVGTDIAIRDWEALVPRHKLGPNGYAFAVNSNGNIVFHPHLKATHEWHREPAHADMLEVELEDEARQRVRNLIVGSLSRPATNNSEPLVTIETFQKVSDGVHIHNTKLAYAYMRINGTPYAASVVLPPAGSRYAAFGSGAQPTFEQADGDSFRWTVTLNDTGRGGEIGTASKHPSLWAAYLVPTSTPFCKEYYRLPPQQQLAPLGENATDEADNGTDGATPPPAAASGTRATRRPPRPRPGGARPTSGPEDEHHEAEQTERLQLSPDTLPNLLQTLALNSSICEPHWAAAVALDLALLDTFLAGFARRPPSPDGPPVRSVAAAGLSGVTGVFPPGEAAVRYRGWRDGWSAGHYQRAVHLPEMLFATVPFLLKSEYNNTEITATPITTMASLDLGVITPNGSSDWMTSTGSPVAPGLPELPEVTLYKATTLSDGFSTGVTGVSLSGRWVADMVFMSTFAALCNPGQVNNTCYLVEDGGYIVSTNQDLKTIGHFLGTIDKPLMRHLVFNLSVFASVQEYDYQALCDKPLPTAGKSDASAMEPLPLGLLVLPAAASLVLLQRPGPLASLVMTLPLVPAMAWGAVPQEDCTKMGYRYYRTRLSESRSEDSQTSTEDELGRRVSLAYLEGTNLMLVAVSWPPGRGHPDLGREHETGAADYDSLRREPEKDDGPDVCVQDFRYRVRPETCYKSHPQEYECHQASASSASVFVIAASVCAAVVSLAHSLG